MSLIDKVLERSEEINLVACEIGRASPPQCLTASGGPCVVIGLYDPTTRIGYAMHEPDPANARGAIPLFLAEARKDYADFSRLRVFVGGANEEADYAKKNTRIPNTRAYTLEQLYAHFKKTQIRVRWVPYGHAYTFCLDTTKGKFLLEHDECE